MNTSNIRNIAIMAHADAGKSTITENVLYLTGKIKKIGSVDNGTTQTDFLPVERERGISVRSSVLSFDWKQTQFNLVDTPGHVDFSADLERVLRIVDAVVLVVSAVEGVQAHTETIFSALKERKIPTLLFINKIDRIGADSEMVLQEIRKDLSNNLFILQSAANEATNNSSINSIWNENNFTIENIETIAATNDELFEKYLDGYKISFIELEDALTQAIRDSKLIPVLFGSAKNSMGIKELLDAMVHYFPSPNGNITKSLSALVYCIDYDKTMGKIANIRIFNGKINNREIIKNYSKQTNEKIISIRKIFSNKFEDLSSAESGNIVGISGLNSAQVGDILGEPSFDIPSSISMRSPLLTVQVKVASEKDYPALAQAMQELCNEEPSLELEWLREERELNVKIMGWIQMEILERILEQRFQIKATFDKPTVIYKETPASVGEGFVQYWMPKPCWAIMKFLIEPAKRGSGAVYESKVGVNQIQQKYQSEVERTIQTALKQGIKGWEVTDLKITLIDGEDHEMHSRPGDFAIATPMGIMNGLVNTGTTFLEPIISFKISAPDSLLGAVTGDITQMRGSFESPQIENGKFLLTGLLPLATSLDYAVKLSSRSGGKAKISTKFHGYESCPENLGIVRPYKGISPLDTAKYILKARNALQ